MHILFLSANDFKEKSIQVLRKTPEAYVAAGHKVTYLVLRDYSKAGNYYYEDEINPDGVEVVRYPMPLTRLRNVSRGLLLTIITQIAAYLGTWKLYRKALPILNSEDIDVVYGYEVQGVNAMKILDRKGKLLNQKQVSRFQGTWIAKYIQQNQKLKMLLNWDDTTALKADADLCIMTDDGTEGDFAMKHLNSKSFSKMKFWVNGVDNQLLPEEEYHELRERFNPNYDKYIILSVSRLEPWKRVERIMQVVKEAVKENSYTQLLYIVIGEGSELNKHKEFVKQEGLEDYIIFEGAVKNSEVKKYLNLANFFFSTYDLSNVGNPLLEAIRAHKIIFTLNNGTTSNWIQHKQNGFIYNIDDQLIKNMCSDLIEICQSEELQNIILNGVKETEQKKLWSWQERFDAEVETVENLFK
jgi:glycosyltransferase involved in cell wall biosynthesis